MAFNLEHWKDPRGTIACVYKDNDMAYVTHGIYCAYEIMSIIDRRPSELKDKTILDYGCGTGKNLRAIHYFFSRAIGYDPVKECIDEAYNEFNKINKKNDKFPNKKDLLDPKKISFTYKLSDIINQQFDYVFSNNVIEHLIYKDACIAIDNMLKMCKPNGMVIFNTFPNRSIDILKKYSRNEKLKMTSPRFGYYLIQKINIL